MIHAYAIEPDVVPSWCDRRSFRFICDKFGLGTPRVLFELPKFSKWKRTVYRAPSEKSLPELDRTRLAELLRLLGDCRVRRDQMVYDGDRSWLENAETEYDRHPFAAIIAMANPRGHKAVICERGLGNGEDSRWDKTMAKTPSRDADALVETVRAMLENCRELHLVDPHFGLENARHRIILEKLLKVAMNGRLSAPRVILHCSDKATLTFFEEKTAAIGEKLPVGLILRFRRWTERDGGERFHNRYILTDIGGITFAGGIDAGNPGQTDDVHLMTAEQYRLRWKQFVADDGSFDLADEPAPVQAVNRNSLR